jgi:hypothetical protein
MALNQIPIVKPSSDAFPRKPAGQLLHSGLILTSTYAVPSSKEPVRKGPLGL